MFQKRMLIISTSIAIAVAGQANADVTIIHDADGNTQVQAGRVKVSTGNSTQIQTGGSFRVPEHSELARSNYRRYRSRRYSKPAFGNTQLPIPSAKINPIYLPSVNRSRVLRGGDVYSRQTSRTSHGSSNSQTTVIRGDGHSNTSSNHDSD